MITASRAVLLSHFRSPGTVLSCPVLTVRSTIYAVSCSRRCRFHTANSLLGQIGAYFGALISTFPCTEMLLFRVDATTERFADEPRVVTDSPYPISSGSARRSITNVRLSRSHRPAKHSGGDSTVRQSPLSS